MNRLTSKLNMDRRFIQSDKLELMLDKLAEYEDLEEQGRLVRLPCKVGDTVYFIKSMFTLLRKPQECQIENWSMYANGAIKFVTKYKDVGEKTFYEESIGKTVFLTLEEAEKALEKEMGK